MPAPALSPTQGTPAASPDPRIEVVAPDDLARHEAEWSDLWARCPEASPFGHPAWLLSWVRHYAPGRCAAVALRDGDRLVGFVPVFCWDGAILLAGTGPSDRGEALIAPGYEAEAPRLLAALPEAAPGPFDRIDLQQLAGGSPFLGPTPEGWREERLDGDPCHVAPLEGEQGLDVASGRQRSHWRQSLRKLARQGGYVSLAETSEVAQAIEDLMTLNERRWGAESVIRDPLLRSLLRDAGPALDRTGLLRLHQVTLGGRRIAVILALAGPWAHHGFISGFDPDHAELSPSAILVGTAMALAAKEGRRHFDFLRGDETYKAVWGAAPVAMRRRVLRASA